MGIIKHYKVEDRGSIYLESQPIKIEIEQPYMPDYSSREGQPLPEEAYVSTDTSPETAEDKAEQIISEARVKAQELVDRAKTEIEQSRRKIRDEVENEMRSKIEKESAARTEEALQTLNQAIVERKKIVKDAEAEILRLSLKVAEQIIRSEVSLHRDVCLNIVTEAISRVSDREQVIVRVNREDVEQVKKYKDRIAGIIDGVKTFSILEDSQVEPGGCVIETNLGFIDARISTKLKSIEEALEKVRDSES